MDASRTNVVSIAGRWSERRHGRDTGREAKEDLSDSHALTTQLQAQNSKLHQAIVEIELARDKVDLSAAGAAEALRRFEQTLSNLRLSLSNQRSASVAIETAAAAGEAAARVKAWMLDVKFDQKSVLRHDLSTDALLRTISESDEIFAAPAS